jgi:hypothetical protein
VKRLVDSGRLTIVDVTPWYTIRTRDKLGGVATAKLDRPTTLTGKWPTLDYDVQEMKSPPYRVNSFQLSIDAVSEVRAFVDLTRNSVVSIEPTGPNARVTAGAEAMRTAQTPERAPGVAPPLGPSSFLDAVGAFGGGPVDNVLPPDGGSSVQAIYFNGNRQFYNWDFEGQTLNPLNVDWPVTLIFSNNANVNKVKDGPLEPKYDQGGTCASPMHMRVGPNFAGMVWDDDSGKKTSCCPVNGGDTHFRVYADHDDSPHRLYTPDLGYYIVASSHRDVNECGSPKQYGWSEDAEGEIGWDAYYMAGWYPVWNYRSMNNSVVTSWIGNRYYQNNGMATEVIVW